MTTTNLSAVEIANKTNEIIRGKPSVFPPSWEINAVVKKTTYIELVDGKLELVEKDYVVLNHSDIVSSRNVYNRADVHLPVEFSQCIG